MFCDAGKIVACGAIGSYWDKTDEISLFTIFVLLSIRAGNWQAEYGDFGKRRLLPARPKKTENPSSITARGFHQKMGCVYKNGVDTDDEEQLYRLEKFR